MPAVHILSPFTLLIFQLSPISTNLWKLPEPQLSPCSEPRGKLPSACSLHTGVGSSWIHPIALKFSEYSVFLATCSHLFTR